MQFSDHKKQMLVGKYPIHYRELVNAYLYDSQARVDNLCGTYEGEKIKVSDLQALVGLAQDFVAGYRLLEGKLELPSKSSQVPLSQPAQNQITRAVMAVQHGSTWEGIERP